MVADTLFALRDEGFAPDVVLAHGGWGESLFVRDVWPACRLIVHAEFYYTDVGVGFDPDILGPVDPRYGIDLRTRNAAMTLALLDADKGVAPTPWQASVFPPFLRDKIEILHEGIDTRQAKPSADAYIQLGEGGAKLRPGDEVITFVNRNLEPHRGFHVFMRALPQILARRPSARAVIVGGDDHSYGPPHASGESWKQAMRAEVGAQLDASRVHFVGRTPYPTLLALLQVSAAHVSLTYPFVLTWSMLDAMSCGALVVGSRTPPVEDVIEHGRNGLLCDFFDVPGIADAVVNALGHSARYAAIRQSARCTVEQRFDLETVCLPRWLDLVKGC